MDDSQFLHQLGMKIRSIRVKKELTQYELAISCEFEAASMSRIESGKTNLTVITLKKIGDALEVSLAEFFTNHVNGYEFNKDGFNVDGFNVDGFGKDGFNKDGLGKDGVSKARLSKNGGPKLKKNK